MIVFFFIDQGEGGGLIWIPEDQMDMLLSGEFFIFSLDSFFFFFVVVVVVDR